METICGADCSKCQFQKDCKGCLATKGRPFGGDCLLAACCDYQSCPEAKERIKRCKATFIDEFNALKIEGMPKVSELYALKGSFVNLEYPLPNGMKAKLLKDNDIYLGTQLPLPDGKNCYGLVAGAAFLLVVEYGENGKDPEIVLFKKRASNP